MPRHSETKITWPDALVIILFTAICATLALTITEPKKQSEQLLPEDYNLLCKKNFEIPSKFNVVLECMHIRTKGN